MVKNIQIPIERYDVISYNDIVYAYKENLYKQFKLPLKLHIYRPFFNPFEEFERLPLLIWISGGAWQNSTPFRRAAELGHYAQQGFVVAMIDYLVAGANQAPFPSQVQDVKSAVRFLRAHADEYGIDKEHVALMGDSAGAHLALLAAFSKGEEAFKTSDWQDEDDAVQAVVDWYGPTDLFTMTGPAADPRSWGDVVSAFLGTHATEVPELTKSASPIAYVTKGLPPVLIMHGTDDMVVPIRQSELLYESLLEAGNDAEFYKIEGATHVGLQFAQPALHEIVLAFLKRTLKIEGARHHTGS